MTPTGNQAGESQVKLCASGSGLPCTCGSRAQQGWFDRTFFFLEQQFEQAIYACRWLMAPIYVGLGVTLLMMLYMFMRELFHYILILPEMQVADLILATLSLIDLSLAANLTVVVLFAGYENFVSKLHLKPGTDRPSWMGKVDFSGLKMKLIASMVAISGIHLLKTFMSLGKPTSTVTQDDLFWLVVIHVIFVVSGVLLAIMDWIAHKTPSLNKD